MSKQFIPTTFLVILTVRFNPKTPHVSTSFSKSIAIQSLNLIGNVFFKGKILFQKAYAWKESGHHTFDDGGKYQGIFGRKIVLLPPLATILNT